MNLFEREAGFEPANTGFADQPLEPLGHSLILLLGWQDLNLRNLCEARTLSRVLVSFQAISLRSA